MTYLEEQRPTWDEYFLMIATGYNGSPSASVHCTTQGFCYTDLSSCDASSTRL